MTPTTFERLPRAAEICAMHDREIDWLDRAPDDLLDHAVRLRSDDVTTIATAPTTGGASRSSSALR